MVDDGGIEPLAQLLGEILGQRAELARAEHEEQAGEEHERGEHGEADREQLGRLPWAGQEETDPRHDQQPRVVEEHRPHRGPCGPRLLVAHRPRHGHRGDRATGRYQPRHPGADQRGFERGEGLE